MKTLVIFAHPRFDRSEVNRPMVDMARKIPGVTVVDLYADYPDFSIDVELEHKRLLDHDAIILQHPLYWYSAPALMKEWLDLVLEHGFAYGKAGHALDDKVVLNVTTAGARRESYSPTGANGAELRDLLIPFEKTFQLCRMHYLAPFAIFGAGHAVEDGQVPKIVAQYRRLLTGFVDNSIDIPAAEKMLTLNDDFERVFLP
jgi:putative NADPH-quinone reductase